MATKSNKPNNSEILAALKVMEDLGERGSRSYSALVARLPKSMQPEESFSGSCGISIVGNGDDPYTVPESTYEKLNAAIRESWTPISVKIGNKTWRVEISGNEPIEV